jgi:hypothetical protein
MSDTKKTITADEVRDLKQQALKIIEEGNYICLCEAAKVVTKSVKIIKELDRYPTTTTAVAARKMVAKALKVFQEKALDAVQL